MFNKGKIFTVYEKPEASDPADRTVLLREGFAFWAFIFGALWLIFNRRWWLLLAYMVVATVAEVLCMELGANEVVGVLAQLFIQLMLAFHANDFQGMILERKGYRFAGVLAAETEMHAERRYEEYAA
jgi:hypothetical protein